MIPVSNDTLLRVVRRHTTDRNDKLSVIGIDDFAFRHDQSYGTIVCDLERRNPITPFPGFALETSRS
jgi:transposase